MTTTLHPITVNARRSLSHEPPLPRSLLAFVVYVFDVESVDMTWEVSGLTSVFIEIVMKGRVRQKAKVEDIPKDGQTDVNPEISTASCDHVDT
jgi:hypothetical protein